MSQQRIGTQCLHAGYTPGNGEPRNIPIVQSTTFRYATGEQMGALFDLEESGYFYTRLQNPTNDHVAAKICALEGGTAAMLTSSGQAASFYAIFNIVSCGEHVVCSSSIYGGTYNLFAVTMKRMGIDFTFVDPDCTEAELEAAFRPETRAVFGETIANPALTVLDFEKFARAAHAHGVLRPAGGDPLHLGRAVVHALGEGHRPTHRRGLGHLRHDHLYARPVQPHRRAGGQISRSLDQNQHNPPRSSSR